MITVGSLFTGIGGMDLGLEQAGFGPVLWQVEIDDFCTKLLERHWPNTTRHRDVTTVGRHNLARCHLLCGGFPCQDVSDAGKRVGLTGSRSGLWREFLRIATELEPAALLIENVGRGAKARWVPFVAGDLEAAGYEAHPYEMSATQVGAPQRRERVFIVAYRRDDGRAILRQAHDKDGCDAPGDFPHRRHPHVVFPRGPVGWDIGASPDDQPALCRGSDGVSSGLDAPMRTKRIHALGNACIPAMVEVMARVILDDVGRLAT